MGFAPSSLLCIVCFLGVLTPVDYVFPLSVRTEGSRGRSPSCREALAASDPGGRPLKQELWVFRGILSPLPTRTTGDLDLHWGTLVGLLEEKSRDMWGPI